MLSKNDRKFIKQISERLPVVNEQTISGFYYEDGEAKPNIVTHPINHERRIRKAYERAGMEGIKAYLVSIQKLKDGQSHTGGSEIHPATA